MVARNKQNFTFISFNAGTVKEYTVTWIIFTSRSARPTDVLWVVAKGVALQRPFGWFEKLETYFQT